MKNGLDTLFAAAEAMELVYVYSMLRLNVDNGDPKYQAMQGRAINLSVKFSTACAFLDPEILSIDKDVLAAMMADPILAGYRHMLEDTDRSRAHTLDAKTEMMLAMLSDAAGTAQNAFTMLESVDMTFPEMQDENGNTVTSAFVASPLKSTLASLKSISTPLPLFMPAA